MFDTVDSKCAPRINTTLNYGCKLDLLWFCIKIRTLQALENLLKSEIPKGSTLY